MGTQARLLREAGYDVRVVTGRGEGELVPELDSRHPAVEAVAKRLEQGDPATAEFAALRERIGEPFACFRADYAQHGWERRGEDNLGAPTGAAFQEGPWLEGSWMTKHRGTYYLQYAAPGHAFVACPIQS